MTEPDFSQVPPSADQMLMQHGFQWRKMQAANTWHRNAMILGLGLCGTAAFLAILSFFALRQYQAGSVSMARIDSGKAADVIAGKFRYDSASLDWAERRAKLRAERAKKK